MPKFSKRSLDRLATVHPDLITLCHYAIKEYDFAVLYGMRSAEQQFDLYKRGRKLVGDAWAIEDKKKVVTYKDGYHKKSRHQLGEAVDLIPYYVAYPHIRWKDTKGLYHFSGYIRGCADMLKRYSAIENDVVWGGDWNDNMILGDQTFFDLVHFQIK